jgi:hypothetical protein
MNTYHKIQSLYKRDPITKYKTFLNEFSIPEFGYLFYNDWVFTEKVDGTNIRVMFDGEDVCFGGKTDKAQMNMDLLNALENIFKPKLSMFKELFPNKTEVCLYGEGYGAGIQKGGCYRQDKSVVLFDIKIGRWWLQRDDIEMIARNLECDIVPIIGVGGLDRAVAITKEGFGSTWGDFIAEGLVARPLVELKSRSGERIITKLKHKDFKHEK